MFSDIFVETHWRAFYLQNSGKMRPIHILMVTIFAFAGLAVPLYGGETTCKPSGIQVNAARSEDADRVCEAVNATEKLFQDCRLPDTPAGLRIDLVNELKKGCVALYHCGENWIEVLSPDAMRNQRLPESAFALLGIDDYFRSVVVHELAHAVFDDMPCPFEYCVASAEYFAYALQVLSLTPEQQKMFEERAELDRKISRNELNAMYLFILPNRFAQKAWIHLSQRDDPCTFLGQVIDGAVAFDREPYQLK